MDFWTTEMFSDAWLGEMAAKYSVTIAYLKWFFGVVLVPVVLKVIAKLNRNVPTDTIKELLTFGKRDIPPIPAKPSI